MPHVIRIGSGFSGASDVTRRRAVKAVTLRGDRLLMLRSGVAGDVKFPGGGVEGSETDREALTRELREECSAELRGVGDAILEVIETRPDTVEVDTDFQMVSVYIPCTVGPPGPGQDLDDYERDLGLIPVWVTAAEALSANADILDSGAAAPWVERETLVLRWLIESGWLTPAPTRP